MLNRSVCRAPQRGRRPEIFRLVKVDKRVFICDVYAALAVHMGTGERQERLGGRRNQPGPEPRGHLLQK